MKAFAFSIGLLFEKDGTKRIDEIIQKINSGV
jgi:hypothetical protein